MLQRTMFMWRDKDNFRIDKFSPSGGFISAWGWGVADGLPAFETCTLSCQAGLPGSGAGQFTAPAFIAVDNSAGASAGDVYVGDTGDNVVSKFTSEGALISSWGTKGQLDGSTTSAGSFAALDGIAVDANGTLMVISLIKGSSFLFEFSHEGIFSTEFEVARETAPVGLAVDSAGNFFKANGTSNIEKVTASDTDVGQVTQSERTTGLAIEASTGDLYAAAGDEVEHYAFVGANQVSEPGGGTCTFGSFSGCPATDTFGSGNLTGATGVGVDSATGSVYVTDATANQVDVFTPALLPDVSAANASNVQPAGAMVSGTVNPDGLQVTACSFEYGPSTSSSYSQSVPCEQSPAAIGSGTSPVTATSMLVDLAPNTEYHVRLSAANAQGTNHGAGETFTTPGPPRIDGESAANFTHATAELQAQIDPSGLDTTYHFEYGTSTSYGSSIPVPPADIGSQPGEQSISQKVSGLLVGTVYHYRVVAGNAAGTVDGPDQTFTTVPAALIDGLWASEVTSTSATLNTEINPLGLNTEYRLEYGTSTSYGQTISGNTGEGEGDVLFSYHRQNLQPAATYHYRITTTNALGTNESTDHTFTTQAFGGEHTLPDGRAWELVSPADKKGALIGPIKIEGDTQAAADGSAITYPASEPVGEGAVGRVNDAQILSKRVVSGWSSQDVADKVSLPPEGIPSQALGGGESWHIFSTDLSLGLVVDPVEESATPQSQEASERTLYLRVSSSGEFVPLETKMDVLSGSKFGDESMMFVAATPDLSHVIFSTWEALTPEAVAPPNANNTLEGANVHNLYEWSAGKLQLVNITPSTPAAPNGTSEPGASLGGDSAMTAHAISRDGRWVVWGYGGLSAPPPFSNVSLYVRDMVGGKTYRLGGDYPRFETMNDAGSKVFFIENTRNHGSGDLYVFDTATGAQTDLTADHAGEPSADVQDAVMGSSSDGSYVYFVATGVLARGAVSGADNVYVLHETGGGWETRYIATLSAEDAKSWRGAGDEDPTTESNVTADLARTSSRVSHNGRYLAFMSSRSLTGYDNLDAVSGQPDEEVYLYDAVTDRLVCASCNPTGARPTGVLDERKPEDALFVDLLTAWSPLSSGSSGSSSGIAGHWLAGSLTGWEPAGTTTGGDIRAYQPRYLSDGGRLFFDSPDALVPQDVNGLEDVYEYEPVNSAATVASDSCSIASSTFSERSQGCVGLISSGQSGSETIFLDASENGDDVFFATNSRLTAEDYDTSYDVYDAHVCSAGEPCRVEPVSPPPCTSGDSCKAAPALQPGIFGSPPSATFSGIGNVEEVKTSAVKRKTKVKHRPKKRKRKAKKARKAHSRRTDVKGGRR